jgi:hypothetical protein
MLQREQRRAGRVRPAIGALAGDCALPGPGGHGGCLRGAALVEVEAPAAHDGS